MIGTVKRSLKYLRDRGYLADKVEQWIPRPHAAFGVRRDLFGIIDVVAIREDGRTLGVQSTTHGGLSSHRLKALTSPSTVVWIRAGNAFEIHGWRKVGRLWQPTIMVIDEPQGVRGLACRKLEVWEHEKKVDSGREERKMQAP